MKAKPAKDQTIVTGRTLKMIKSRVPSSTKESKIKFKPFKSAENLKKTTHSDEKLTARTNTFSNKGFGNGFVSKADRFSGVNES